MTFSLTPRVSELGREGRAGRLEVGNRMLLKRE